MDGDLHGCFVRLGVVSRPELGQSDAVLVCKRTSSSKLARADPRVWVTERQA